MSCLVLFLEKAVSAVVLQPDRSHVFKGERITIRCEIQGRGDTDWTYEWDTPNSSLNVKNQAEFTIDRVSVKTHSGDYKCKGLPKNGLQPPTEWSDAVELTVSGKSQYLIYINVIFFNWIFQKTVIP